MVRVKRGVVAGKRRKNIVKLAKSYYGARSRTYKSAKQAVLRARQYSYHDRRKRISRFRCEWIKCLNAKIRIGSKMSYSKFVYLLKKSGILLNRKILASNLISFSALFFTYIFENKVEENGFNR